MEDNTATNTTDQEQTNANTTDAAEQITVRPTETAEQITKDITPTASRDPLALVDELASGNEGKSAPMIDPEKLFPQGEVKAAPPVIDRIVQTETPHTSFNVVDEDPPIVEAEPIQEEQAAAPAAVVTTTLGFDPIILLVLLIIIACIIFIAYRVSKK